MSVCYGFICLDFNNDDMLDADDLRKTLECLTGDKLEGAEKERVIQKVCVNNLFSVTTDRQTDRQTETDKI